MHEIQTQRNRQVAIDTSYMLRRLNIVMRPREHDPLEAGGVLNPGGARARNGDYLLFPRLVARGNFSRIGMSRVLYDAAGYPTDVERIGMALEPSEPYELNPRSGGGCEDPRITFVPSLDLYVMTYVAYGPLGPRAAMAVSGDLYEWTRIGPIDFAPYLGADMNVYGNKDALLFPEPVTGPDGRPSLALLHRPMYELWSGASLGEHTAAPLPPGVTSDIWTIWISFCALEDVGWATAGGGQPSAPPTFGHHHELLMPEYAWEAIRLGGGTPPILLAEGWFTIYHGIGSIERPGGRHGLRYTAGALVLDTLDPRRILYRSPRPILEPMLPEECSGVVADVVFPTALDPHETYLDVYYGMADACIGAARMSLLDPV